MSDELDREVLWLRKPKERESPPSLHAVLWPAVEYTALIFGQAARTDVQLDPFERAVLGASSNGLVEIKKQAELLNLHDGFVGHLQERLREKGLLDERGRLTGHSEELLLPQSHVAVRLYQDPWTGLLWPRFITEQWRRTLPVESSEGRLRLMAGSTGRPVEIRAFLIRHSSGSPAPPTSDDAAFAVLSWTRLRSRIRVGDFAIPQRGPIKLLPDSGQLVYLCCPNHRGRIGRPDVDDPFGGPTWAPFMRSLAERSRLGQPLAAWLYGKDAEGRADDSDVSLLDADQSLVRRIDVLSDRAATANHREWAQLRLDLENAGHEAVDVLWSYGTENVYSVLLDAETDWALLESSCLAFGFDPNGLPVVRDLAAVSGGASGVLRERCAALLLRHRPDMHGPIHRLAARCPDLFTLLHSAAGEGWSADTAMRLTTAVIALGESAADDRVGMTKVEVTLGEE